MRKFLFASLFLMTGLTIAIYANAQQNMRGIVILRAIATGTVDSSGILKVRTAIAADMLPHLGDLTGCDGMLYSRLHARDNLALATTIMDQVTNCHRIPNMQILWRGNLMWLQGDAELAAILWSSLNSLDLFVRGRAEIRANNLEKGVLMLELAVQEDISLSRQERANLYFELAEGYRKIGEIQQAFVYYEKAWLLNPSYKLAYELGRIYRIKEEYDLAITTLEYGLTLNTGQLSGFLGSNYLVELGRAYAGLGYFTQADKLYIEALAILNRFEDQESVSLNERRKIIYFLQEQLREPPQEN